jgi:hypothetical protein
MKKILLTTISVTALISNTYAQTNTESGGIHPIKPIQINSHQIKANTGKSSIGTGSSGGRLGSVNSNTTTTSATTKSGGFGGAAQSNGSTGTTTSMTPATSGQGGFGGAAQNGGTTTSTTSNAGNVSSSDAYSAVRQLLITGVTAAVSKVGVTDGYYGNPDIKIQLPSQLQQVGSLLTTYGAGALVDKLVLQLNRSAEQSATLATPIFINSLTQITPNDAINIISGQQQNAATLFLQRTTTEQLVVALKPQVKNVLDATKTSEVYADVMNLYNKIPFVSPQSADLPDYVTRQALNGLFIMVGREEAKIRANPAAAGSSIISKVLGAILGGQSSLAAKRR